MNKLREEKSESTEVATTSKKQRVEEQAKQLMKNPCFILAHELYDALPIH
jgi:hypothetical protein